MPNDPLLWPPHRLGISSWVWGSDYYNGRFSLLDFPTRAATHHISLLECNDFMLPPPRFSRIARPLHHLIPHANPELWRYRRATLKQLKHEIDRHQQTCLCWTMNTDFSRFGLAKWANRYYQSWGRQAVEILGAQRLRIIAGGANDAQLTPQTATTMARFIREMLDQTTLEMIVFENHWGLSTNIIQHMTLYTAVRQQLNPADQSKFWLCLDPQNIPNEIDKQQAWQQMAGYTRHVHIKNGTAEFTDFLTQIAYQNMVVIEDAQLLSSLPS